MMSPTMAATAIELLQAQKRGKNITLSDVLTICRERRIDPDPVVLVTLRMVRDLRLSLRPVPEEHRMEPVCWFKVTYHELPFDRRSPVVLDSPEMADAMNLYNEVTGGRFVRAKPEDNFPKLIPRPAIREQPHHSWLSKKRKR